MRITQFEIILTVASLIFFSGNPIDLLLFGSGGDQTIDYANSSSLGPLIVLVIGFFSFVLLALRGLLWRLKGKNQFSILAFVLICSTVIFAGLSTLWSVDPNITLRRSLTLAATTTFAIYFSLRFSYRKQIQLLALSFLAVTFACFTFGSLIPQYGQMQIPPHAGAWRGVFTHKNALGGQMSMTAAFFLLHFNAPVIKETSIPPWIYQAVLPCSLLMILASRSSGALLNFFIVAIAILLCRLSILRSRAVPPLLLFSLSSLLGMTIALYSQLESILGIFGKDISLTGRDELWLALFRAIQQHPWLGYGYEGFWRGIHSPAFTIWKIVGWSPPHAHNGLLDLLLAFGFIGTTMILIAWLISLIKSILIIRINQTPESCWPIIFMLSLALKNMTESIFIGNHISWILFVWICLIPYFSTLKPRAIVEERMSQFRQNEAAVSLS